MSETASDAAAAAAALADAAAAGIHRLAIPTPFAVGRVNAYLIEDEPLTLIDSGPNSGRSLDSLERQLDEHGHRLADIGLVFVTHQHPDHVGLADIVARRASAEVASLDLLAPYLRAFSADMDADDRFAAELMLRHGIPADAVVALRAVAAIARGWGSAVEVTRPLPAGTRLTLRDRELIVLHRPGHSPSDTLLWDEVRRIAIVGDHLLPHVSSNPLIARPLDGSPASVEHRPHALLTYLRSLRATRELPARLLLGGHGDPIVDHVSLIDERLRMHERRAERIHRLVCERPLTAYEVAQELWGRVALTQAFLTLSEVLGHADLLAGQGRMREIDDGELIRLVGC